LSLSSSVSTQIKISDQPRDSYSTHHSWLTLAIRRTTKVYTSSLERGNKFLRCRRAYRQSRQIKRLFLIMKTSKTESNRDQAHLERNLELSAPLLSCKLLCQTLLCLNKSSNFHLLEVAKVAMRKKLIRPFCIQALLMTRISSSRSMRAQWNPNTSQVTTKRTSNITCLFSHRTELSIDRPLDLHRFVIHESHVRHLSWLMQMSGKTKPKKKYSAKHPSKYLGDNEHILQMQYNSLRRPNYPNMKSCHPLRNQKLNRKLRHNLKQRSLT
jgi:hypothetical protein